MRGCCREADQGKTGLTVRPWRCALPRSRWRRFVAVEVGFHIGFSLLSAIILLTICCAGEARVIRLASPGAAVGASPDSCRPALTGEGGPVAWQVLLVHNRAALAEMSRVAVDNRFPLCVVDTVKARDVELGVSFTPVAGKIDQAAGLIFRVRDANNYYVVRANALENNVKSLSRRKGGSTANCRRRCSRSNGQDAAAQRAH